MVLYVAIVAILNVALGYALAVYLRSARSTRRSANSESESSYDESGEYGAGDSYQQRTYEHELESSVRS
jgi:hypothetical protein